MYTLQTDLFSLVFEKAKEDCTKRRKIKVEPRRDGTAAAGKRRPPTERHEEDETRSSIPAFESVPRLYMGRQRRVQGGGGGYGRRGKGGGGGEEGEEEEEATSSRDLSNYIFDELNEI